MRASEVCMCAYMLVESAEWSSLRERECARELVFERAPWLLLVNKITRTQRMIDRRSRRATSRSTAQLLWLWLCLCSINLTTLCFCLPAAHKQTQSLPPSSLSSPCWLLWRSLLWLRFLRFKKIHNYVFRYARLIRASCSPSLFLSL